MNNHNTKLGYVCRLESLRTRTFIDRLFNSTAAAMRAFCIAAFVLAISHQQARSAETPFPLSDKTMVVWCSPSDLNQRGGGVLTLENPENVFDAIVYGEISPGKWMAGSEGFNRTEKNQDARPVETVGPEKDVQIAIVYRGEQVSIYRDGILYAEYSMTVPPVTFGNASIALLGLRHRMAGNPRFFTGTIDDARIYATALDAATIASLKPNEPSEPKPVAWWSFENDMAEDHMGMFARSHLVGGAKIKDGKLCLEAGESYLIAGAEPPRSRATEDWPTWHISALPDEGHCLPYDANGCIFWKGQYHLMYIFQNHSLPECGHSWGHATSSDLVNWTFHPAALVPAPGDADKGTFSGNAFVNKEGKPMLCWFGIEAGVCVATAEDDALMRWKKHPNNPIIGEPALGSIGHGEYRPWDPYLWLEGDTYYCIVGNIFCKDKPPYLLKSTDLVNWTPLHSFFDYPDRWRQPDEDCSCPDFFRLGDKHVLMCISHSVGARAYLGQFQGEKFHPEQHVRMNWPGGTFFAPESLEDDRGRRIFWAWIVDPRIGSTKNATGSGVLSLPRVLSLDSSGSLQIAPAPELQTLRRNEKTLETISLAADQEMAIPNVLGDSLELNVEIDVGGAREVGLKVRCSPDGKEETAISYDSVAKVLKIDVSNSTLRTDVVYGATPLDMAFGNEPRTGPHPRGTVEAPFSLGPGEALKLRVFLDKPVLEVFANDRQCVTQQIFPASRKALGVKAYARGGSAVLRAGKAWDMAPATFIDEKAGRSAVSWVTREPCDKDLVPLAQQTLYNFMVLNPQPLPDHPELYRVMFDCMGLPPSTAGTSQWGWGDGTGRAVEAWIALRQMTGDREFGRKIEIGQRALLEWLLTPETGLAQVPDLSHPDRPTYYYHMWDQGRTLRALVRCWLATEDAEERKSLEAKIDTMVQSLEQMAVKREDAQWGSIAEFPYDVLNNGNSEESFAPMSGGQLIEPLAMYWAANDNPAARTFADALCNGVIAATDDSSKSLNYRFGQDGSFIGHFHNKSSIALGVAKQGIACLRHGERDRGLKLLRWAKMVYDWTLSAENINRGSTWGWFPESMGDGSQVRTVMEICCTADMIELAAVLASAASFDTTLADWDALWDHVERYSLGAVAHSQFTVTPAYRDLVDSMGGDITQANRLVGAWAGYHPPNDWVTTEFDNGRHEMLMGCCCNYSGIRAIYACWQSVFDDDGRQLTIRLPVARQTATACQTVIEGPEEVRQSLRLLAERTVRVRIPDWVPLESVEAFDGHGAKRAFSVEGRYLNVGRLSQGDQLMVTYPLQWRNTQETVGGDGYRELYTSADHRPTYEVLWRGNRVVGMKPAGRLLPIFSNK